MIVTNVSGSGPWTLTVTRGVNSTTVAAHNAGKIVYKVVADTTIQVTNTGGTSSVQSWRHDQDRHRVDARDRRRQLRHRATGT